jgi:hypothetical protein
MDSDPLVWQSREGHHDPRAEVDCDHVQASFAQGYVLQRSENFTPLGAVVKVALQ